MKGSWVTRIIKSIKAGELLEQLRHLNLQDEAADVDCASIAW